ncbi:helix-turn-helix transcriptional regulator [Actinokineospora auranticolor]|uniref:Helix-turn-helix protein n=1 Tax=Actinokineospora auranticolor TaxID=155976 RepID=A0A2S6GI46_9PSEU|nr:helix-turn-helix transcriptional regulator [Actinokineospora auranticolor]PPK64885.1 helix-turn-helix protein [Actinokineospora auranticolor]
MSKTPKAVALGRALRQAREQRRVSLRDFAFRIDRDAPTLSRWETGDRVPRPEQVARILAALRVRGERFDRIMALTQGIDLPQWITTDPVERGEQRAAYLAYEQGASGIVQISPLQIPELLQTEEVATAIATASGVPLPDVPRRTADTLGRATAVTRQQPARLTALIGLSALHQNVGGPEAGFEQLRHLVEMAKLPNVEVLVVPFGLGWHPALDGAFSLLESSARDTVAFVETRVTTLWLHRSEDVRTYQRDADAIRALALSPLESLRTITDTAQRLRASGKARAN